MVEERAKRKLTAILSADVKGYSRLMGEDELSTVETLKGYREIISSLVRQYSGRVVDSPGDNILAEFSSVVDAVECAVKIQEEVGEENANLPDNRRMEFRIGVNLGDVIDDEGRIYGDGVNVAARLEGLADPGGICISGTAYDQIGNKLALGYEYLGEQEVKNIEKPVRIYRVLTDSEAAGKVIGELKPKTRQLRGVAIGAIAVLTLVLAALLVWNFYFRQEFEPASVEKMAYPLPDKPSIAVLPFENMSGDAKQEYLADGITENIISALSTVPKLFVIARNSTFTYKSKPVKVQKVAEELGVRYILEGSVQISDQSLRITAQLIDAVKGHHLWSQRYDRKLKDIFILQDDIAKEIVAALQVKLTEGERARFGAKGTENLEAYLKYLKAREPFHTVTREGNVLARRLLEEVIAMDPKFPSPYLYLGGTYFMDVPLGLSKSHKESYMEAFRLTKKAISLDRSLAPAYPLLGWLYVIMMKQYDQGVAECDKAIALAPNLDVGYIWKGFILAYAGRHTEAVQFCEKALRLNPIPPGWFFRALGIAYSGAGNYEKATEAFKKSLQRAPNDILTHEALTVNYSWAGRAEDARTQAAEVFRINPKSSIEELAKRILYKNQIDQERYLDGLRKAGIPETPPLPLPDKPSIAVLPFKNMSGDPKQEYFSDGITEQIITGLSRVPKLFVIARTSSFKYKGKDVDVRRVGRELGVRYALEGSVQRSGNRLRITAQLIDAVEGHHLWSEIYDRELKDIFALQDEITLKILVGLQVKLTEGDQARTFNKGTVNLGSYLKWLEGINISYRMEREGNTLARSLFKEAIELDSMFPFPYVGLAWTHMADVWFGWTDDAMHSMRQAYQLLQKSIELDSSVSGAHALLGHLYTMSEQHEKAIDEGVKAITLAPNSADANGWLGMTMNYADRPEEGMLYLEKAMRLNPFPPSWYFTVLGQSLMMIGHYEKAIEEYKKCLIQSPNQLFAHIGLLSTYVLLDRVKDAKAEAEKIRKIDPDFSPHEFAAKSPHKNKSHVEAILNSLRKAGLM